ncbi:hypothetical protein QBC34DRAFT_407272 [Podospora aff. communis PSN243]|uniref:GRF-like zinc ribbon domain-containing protein n=1 Tax=Podospora aff. communis PSN243 TaxID=3040156 RepID=A0AAV9GHW3_9PEZI|nr:hypothetical protein QBC34DRAFT_407272 [Podospora aff. communis PSN243]
MSESSTPASATKRRVGSNAVECDRNPSKRLRPASQQATPTPLTKTKPGTIESSPTNSATTTSASGSPYINSPNSAFTTSCSNLKRNEVSPETPARKLAQDAAIQGVLAFVKAWNSPRDPHKMIDQYCTVLKSRNQPMTLAEIWAFPKTENGNPPWPKTYGPRCHKAGCFSHSALLETSQDNLRGNAGRPFYKCAKPECGAFVTWADRRGVEDSNVACFCGMPCRKAMRCMVGKAWWECWDGECGFKRFMGGTRHENK